ncbi:unnamed protein product [Natator depressus]
MASALTVLLLGCWLAGWSGVSGHSFHMRGGGCHWKDARFAWWGQGLGELPRNGEPHPGGPTDRGDGGSYSCQDSTKWDWPVWSEPSDPVQLVVADSFHMRGGGCHWKDARFAWWGQGLGELPRNGEPHPGGPTDRGDGGSYSCQDSTKWDWPVWSEPSDPVQLVVAGELTQLGPSSRTPHLPTEPAGEEGTDPIQLEVTLAPTRPGSTGPDTSTGGRKSLSTPPEAELPRNGEPHPGSPTDRGDGGSYCCQDSTKWDSPVWSEPSDPGQLVVAEGTDPIQLQTTLAPTHPDSMGQGTSTGGRKSPSTPPEADRGDGGSYSCQDSTKWDWPVWSEPSDPVQLVVAAAAAPPAFTNANIAPLVLGTVVLLILGLLLDPAVQGRESPRG